MEVRSWLGNGGSWGGGRGKGEGSEWGCSRVCRRWQFFLKDMTVPTRRLTLTCDRNFTEQRAATERISADAPEHLYEVSVLPGSALPRRRCP